MCRAACVGNSVRGSWQLGGQPRCRRDPPGGTALHISAYSTVDDAVLTVVPLLLRSGTRAMRLVLLREEMSLPLEAILCQALESPSPHSHVDSKCVWLTSHSVCTHDTHTVYIGSKTASHTSRSIACITITKQCKGKI